MQITHARRFPKIWIVLAVLCAVGLLFAAYRFLSPKQNRNILWIITHDTCVPDAEKNHNPAPCAVVDLKGGLAQGYVLLKDIHGAAQYLVIPTRRISGIDSPDILGADLPNYWADAWANRGIIAAKLHHAVAWDMIGLAINSALARSQDQLHIHLDCVRPDVRAALAQHQAEIGPHWAELPFALAGTRYYARRLAAADLAEQDPFHLLAEGVPDARSHMQEETLAVIGVGKPPEAGFVLLAARADPEGWHGHSEDLLDHRCTVAK